MFEKLRELFPVLTPPYTGSDYMDRMAAKHAAYERLRDEFAMAALTSMLSAPQELRDDRFQLAATLSYKFADAMMIERREKGRFNV